MRFGRPGKSSLDNEAYGGSGKMTFKLFKLSKVELDLYAASYAASMVAIWSGTVWIWLFVLLRR